MMDLREFSLEIWSIELPVTFSHPHIEGQFFEGGVSIWLCPTPPQKKSGNVFIDAESLKIISCLIKIDTLRS